MRIAIVVHFLLYICIGNIIFIGVLSINTTYHLRSLLTSPHNHVHQSHWQNIRPQQDNTPRNLKDIFAYYFVLPHWDVFTDGGDYDCGEMRCHFKVENSLESFSHSVQQFNQDHSADDRKPLLITIYNYKSWFQKTKAPSPPLCGLHSDLTHTELMEAIVRTEPFKAARMYYNGDSSTHPSSSIQRFYPEAYLAEELMFPVKKMSELINGATFISSNFFPLTKRLEIVDLLKKSGLRIDGLGECLRTDFRNRSPSPEINWQDWQALMTVNDKNESETRWKKRKMMNHYMFHLAFENTYEDGYVTEKLFDSLLAGSIPIYLGDSKMARRLLSPEVERGVIFLDDFKKVDARADAVIDQETLDTVRLVRHMKEIMDNSTRFEEMWSWRKGFSSTEYQKNHALLSKSWQCRVCEWGSEQYPKKVLEVVASPAHSGRCTPHRAVH